MLKILMCDCKRFGLDQLNVKYKSSFGFDVCSCGVEHKIFATECENCCYDVAGFARNYFSRINCSCQFISKDVACSHCRQLVRSLNPSTIKVCVEENDLPEDFNLIEIDKYVEMYLKADPIFYYSKENNQIQLSADSPDWGNFFINKKTL